MAGYLLDTHAALWFFKGDEKLSAAARCVIGDDFYVVYLSVASAWELSIKIGLGKLEFPGNGAGFLRMAQVWDIAILPIEAEHLSALEGLPLIHRDPFDRLLVATALAEKMTLVTTDQNIAQYDVPHIW